MGTIPQNDKWISAGGVVIKQFVNEFKVLLVQPTNFFGGYEWTFPKGRVEPNESKESAAIREVQEESGYRVKMLPNSYLGSGEGDMSITHYWIMEPIGKSGMKDSEMADAKFFSFKEAKKLLSRSARDIAILTKAQRWAETNYR